MNQNDVDSTHSLALETAWQRYAQFETNAIGTEITQGI